MTSNPYKIDTPFVISFSGGRTSGYMLKKTIDAYDGTLPPDCLITFCNTGKELPQTLDFVRDCQEKWAVPIRWLEYRRDATKPLVKMRGKQLEMGQHSWAEVNYETASRKGEPFEQLIDGMAAFRTEGKGLDPVLPNPVQRFCTAQMKKRTMERFLVLERPDWDHYTMVVGLRADEPKRVSKLKALETQTRFYETPIADAGETVEHVMAFWESSDFDLQLSHDPELGTYQGNCSMCLAAETEVVTSEGIKPIGSLVGQSPELLVPKVVDDITSEVGHFVSAPVRSFGVQQLWKITLSGKGRSSKTVYATAEHRWFLHPHHKYESAVLTTELKTGDKLRNLKRCPIGTERGGSSELGAMRGFVFGDGTVPSGDRPGTVQVFEGKAPAFKPLFDVCLGEGKLCQQGEEGFWLYYGVPRYWKLELPDLNESRQYLMGWLSGYFAADGCVSEDGNCILASTDRGNVQFVRSLCAVLGVQTYPLRSQVRTVTLPGSGRQMESEIFLLNINRHHLTGDFFRLPHHKERAVAVSDKQDRRYGWTVESVEPTERTEEVFCATVEGVGAFGLSDGLMTGNCFLKSRKKINKLMEEMPDEAEWWAEQEEKTGQTFRRDRPSYGEMLKSRIPLTQCDDDQDTCYCTD
jgi:3'-phosphoadenosine 5'-phosphosulfate sulfotransferase (PAPS reductase)/FAD synthetase